MAPTTCNPIAERLAELHAIAYPPAGRLPRAAAESALAAEPGLVLSVVTGAHRGTASGHEVPGEPAGDRLMSQHKWKTVDHFLASNGDLPKRPRRESDQPPRRDERDDLDADAMAQAVRARLASTSRTDRPRG